MHWVPLFDMPYLSIESRFEMLFHTQCDYGASKILDEGLVDSIFHGRDKH